MNELLNSYAELIEIIDGKLEEDKSWLPYYKGYGQQLARSANEEKYKKAKRTIRKNNPFELYVTMGAIDEKTKPIFHLRYLGQSIGKLEYKNDQVYLSVADKQEQNEKYFAYKGPAFEDEKWTSPKAREFRSYFTNAKDFEGTKKDGLPYSPEHMVENALFSELGKRSSTNKSLLRIRPISYGGNLMHLKTAVKGSDTKNDIYEISDKGQGGEIDCLCRRTIGGGKSRLVVIEVKDQNQSGETFDIAIKQVLTYAVFLRKLLRSEAGKDWKKVLGMKNQYKSNIEIEAVAAMPAGEINPSFQGHRFVFANGDFIDIHYMKFTSEINPDKCRDIDLETSFEKEAVMKNRISRLNI